MFVDLDPLTPLSVDPTPWHVSLDTTRTGETGDILIKPVLTDGARIAARVRISAATQLAFFNAGRTVAHIRSGAHLLDAFEGASPLIIPAEDAADIPAHGRTTGRTSMPRGFLGSAAPTRSCPVTTQ